MKLAEPAPPDAALPACAQAGAAALAAFARAHRRLFVLTGAGVSTGSGIPDYRDADGAWKRKPPVSHQAFMGEAAVRRRYWARSMLGWPLLADAHPNPAHAGLARLEAAGRITQVVTQNVDGLHQRAGSRAVLELHGSIHAVTCMACRAASPRLELQAALERANPDFLRLSAGAAPDGDADLEDAHFERFTVPACTRCGGLLKPDVVFYGDGVPKARLAGAIAALEAADAVLVAGSSLMVYSGYRFCLLARQMGKPIAAVNLGQTRADALLDFKLAAPCDTALPALADALER